MKDATHILHLQETALFSERQKITGKAGSAKHFWEVCKMEMIIEMFSYPFMVRAFTVGALVALCSALLGVSLVLKRYS